MAKQSKSACVDSSAGCGAASVSNVTDAGAAPLNAPGAPAAVAPSAEPSVEAEDCAALLSVVKSMYGAVPDNTAVLEAEARASARNLDHAQHTVFSRLATVFVEFRNGLADYFTTAG
jgi:hypothetical protein